MSAKLTTVKICALAHKTFARFDGLSCMVVQKSHRRAGETRRHRSCADGVAISRRRATPARGPAQAALRRGTIRGRNGARRGDSTRADCRRRRRKVRGQARWRRSLRGEGSSREARGSTRPRFTSSWMAGRSDLVEQRDIQREYGYAHGAAVQIPAMQPGQNVEQVVPRDRGGRAPPPADARTGAGRGVPERCRNRTPESRNLPSSRISRRSLAQTWETTTSARNIGV